MKKSKVLTALLVSTFVLGACGNGGDKKEGSSGEIVS